MDIIEPPYIDPDRKFNPHGLGALFLVIFVGVLAEFYIVRPPVGTATRAAQ
jgi:hypothetical protein